MQEILLGFNLCYFSWHGKKKYAGQILLSFISLQPQEPSRSSSIGLSGVGILSMTDSSASWVSGNPSAVSNARGSPLCPAPSQNCLSLLSQFAVLWCLKDSEFCGASAWKKPIIRPWISLATPGIEASSGFRLCPIFYINILLVMLSNGWKQLGNLYFAWKTRSLPTHPRGLD